MTSKSRLLAVVASLGIGVGMMALTSGAAFASTSASSSVAADITGGTLSVSAPSSLSYSATLDGSNQSLSQPATLGANDNTGTGDGWDLTVVSTALETGATTPVVIPSDWTVQVNGSSSSATSTTAPAVSENQPSGSTGTYTDPSGNTATYPLSVPGIHGASSPTPVSVYNAAVGSGMGDFNLAADVWQNIPANALAGSYSATFTWAIAVGP
jgi:hypothetical protein